jgi:hypothetical protein
MVPFRGACRDSGPSPQFRASTRVGYLPRLLARSRGHDGLNFLQNVTSCSVLCLADLSVVEHVEVRIYNCLCGTTWGAHRSGIHSAPVSGCCASQLLHPISSKLFEFC